MAKKNRDDSDLSVKLLSDEKIHKFGAGSGLCITIKSFNGKDPVLDIRTVYRRKTDKQWLPGKGLTVPLGAASKHLRLRLKALKEVEAELTAAATKRKAKKAKK